MTNQTLAPPIIPTPEAHKPKRKAGKIVAWTVGIALAIGLAMAVPSGEGSDVAEAAPQVETTVPDITVPPITAAPATEPTPAPSSSATVVSSETQTFVTALAVSGQFPEMTGYVPGADAAVDAAAVSMGDIAQSAINAADDIARGDSSCEMVGLAAMSFHEGFGSSGYTEDQSYAFLAAAGMAYSPNGPFMTAAGTC